MPRHDAFVADDALFGLRPNEVNLHENSKS
jgi:hypothetical protein